MARRRNKLLTLAAAVAVLAPSLISADSFDTDAFDDTNAFDEDAFDFGGGAPPASPPGTPANTLPKPIIKGATMG